MRRIPQLHATRTKAEISFWAESGFRADAAHGKTWGARAHTPVVQVPGQRQSLSAASAISSKGAFWFATYAGALTGPLFVDLLRRMMRRHREDPLLPPCIEFFKPHLSHLL